MARKLVSKKIEVLTVDVVFLFLKSMKIRFLDDFKLLASFYRCFGLHIGAFCPQSKFFLKSL